jgi:exopolyphosphatase / guanosine-5'-triphosphate,3'-diphosphate pyrophosphatase
MELAVLDLGSTTFHLQHFRADEGQAFVTLLDTKRTPLLGAQVFAEGYIDRRAWLESLEAVWELISASRGCRPDRLVVVATSAIRTASNGAALVREIEQRHGVSVRILDPSEEARLAYLGHTTSPLVGGRRVAVIDLGGGSVEVAVGEGTRCIHAASLPIGAVRMRARHRAAFTRKEALELGGAVRNELLPTLRVVHQLAPEIVTFGSGSARAVRKLLFRDTVAPGKVGPIELSHLRTQLEAHLGLPEEALIELGVDPARAGTVLVSATIMVQILDVLDAHRALVSDKGLRDGVALDAYRATMVERRTGVATPVLPSVQFDA